jgi:hypothetical protein
VDIHPQRSQIHEGEVSQGVKPKGKAFGVTKLGMTGINSYTDWFAGDAQMEGKYGGYDGPFPPWNDERIHHYHFKLFALDVPSLELAGPFTGPDALKAMEGHIVEEAEWIGTYSLNASLLKVV